MTRSIREDAYSDIIQTLQKVEQSAARLANDAQHLKHKELQARVDNHERAVVFAVIALTETVQRLQRGDR
jgi:hypothetical protein